MEYKMIETGRRKEEALMNEMAKQGWKVVCMTHWRKWFTYSLLITFEKEK